MEFFRTQTTIDFMKLKRPALMFSLAIALFSMITLAINGLNLGLDFTGGMQIEAHYPSAVQLEPLRARLANLGFGDAKVQHYGASDKVMIRIASGQGRTHETLKAKLPTLLPDAHIDRIEFIGPQVGKSLIENGILAVVVSMLATMIYIALRFEMRFAISATVALIHDPVLILGIFSLFHIEFDLIALAALLTILGYSINDTIVVYDRVRENLKLYQNRSMAELINLSVNQTLSRTIMTSGITLLVVLALCLLGGTELRGFSIALIVGILIGTYSSIYIAGSLAVSMGLSRESLLPTDEQKRA